MFRGSILQRGLLLSTEMRLKQVMAAERDEGAVFEPIPTPLVLIECQLDRCRQVIVANACRNASKVLECLHMRVEEAFLLLGWKAHHD